MTGKRILCAVLCCVMLIAGLPMASYAEESAPAASVSEETFAVPDGASPYYIYTNTLTASLSINDGKTTCTAVLSGHSGTIKTVMMRVYLEKKTLWWWNEADSWTQLYTDDYCYFSRQIAAGSGTYRLHVVATVTGTDGGSEEVSAYSSEVKA